MRAVHLALFYVLYLGVCEAANENDVSLATLAGPFGFTINGALVGDSTGVSVSNAGDVNKDGIDDMIIGAHLADGNGRLNSGVAYVIFGRSKVNQPTSSTNIDLTTILTTGTTQGFCIWGPAPNDLLGFSVSGAGDVNKDGINDVIVGAHNAGGGSIGITYIIFGRDFATGSSSYTNIDVDPLYAAGTPLGFRILGAVYGDLCGVSVSGAGDVNGDSIADVIIGCAYASPNVGGTVRPGAGTSYVIFGRSKDVNPTASYANIDLLPLNTAGSSVGFAIFGAAAVPGAPSNRDKSGHSVSGAGDVNGDGLDDVIVGAPQVNRIVGGATSNMTGFSYVIFGRKYNTAGYNENIDLSAFATAGSAVGFAIRGAAPYDGSGVSVGAAGDVNKDGIADVIVGAANADPVVGGISYVIFGRTIGTSGATGYYSNIDLAGFATGGSTLGFAILGVSSTDRTGSTVNGAGDVNGDGVDDIIVGAALADAVVGGTTRNDAGVSYVIYGRPLARGASSYANINLVGFASSSSLGYRIMGASTDDYSGISVSCAGDVNSDGIDDLVVGAYNAKVVGQANGAAYIIFGSIATPTSQPSSHPSRQPSAQPSAQPLGRPTSQPSCQPTRRPSAQPSMQPTKRPSPQPSCQPSSQPSSTPTRQPSNQPSARPSRQPSVQPSSQPSAQPISGPTTQPSAQPSGTPSGMPSAQPTSRPTAQPSLRPSVQPSVRPTMQPTARPTSQPSTAPTLQPSAQPSATPTMQPTCQPSPPPSSVPSDQPTVSPTAQPTDAPSTQPSGKPTCKPSSQPTSVPSGTPSTQPSSGPSVQPSTQPSSSPTVQPSSGPSGQPSAAPASTPTSVPSVLPSAQPSSQPTGWPSSRPSAQPTVVPSTQPSSTPSGQPSCEPSSRPSTQPTTAPSSQPSSQPSSIPSSQPSQQPRAAPSSQPSSSPTARPTLPPTGEWAMFVDKEAHLATGAFVGEYVWACGREFNMSSAVCVLVAADTGAVVTQYVFEWDTVTSVLSASSGTDSVVISGQSSHNEIKTNEIALCTMEQYQLQCAVTSFHDSNFTAASYVQYAKKLVYVGWYNIHTTVTVIDPATALIQSYMYTASNMKALVLSQVTSPPYFVGGFVAGTTIRATASPVNYIVAGMVRTEAGIFSAMVLMPQSGDIINSADLVTSMALDALGPDSFIAGALQLSSDTGQHAYVVRANALFMSVQYCACYRDLLGGGRRALSAVAVSRSVVRGMVLVETALFMIVDCAHDNNVTSLTVLKTRASDGAIIKQVHVTAPNGTSLHCTDLTQARELLSIVCSVQVRPASVKPQSLLLTVDQDLSLAVLPVGFTRSDEGVFQVEKVPFKRTVLTITKTSTDIPTSTYEFTTADNGPTRRPSAAPSYTPSTQPSSAPSAQPSSSPTAAPSVSARPTSQPSSASPTNTHKPTEEPTLLPTRKPTVVVTARPSFRPSGRPSVCSTVQPSTVPTIKPTARPSVCPSIAPLPRPSIKPTPVPSGRPTSITMSPSAVPSLQEDVVVGESNRSRMPPYVAGASVGGGLGLLLVGYFVYQYYQNDKEAKAREVRKAEYYRQQAILVAQSRAETDKYIQEENDRFAAIKLEKELRREERRAARHSGGGGGARGGGAYAVGPVHRAAEIAPVLSAANSSVTVSSLHSSEMSSEQRSQSDELSLEHPQASDEEISYEDEGDDEEEEDAVDEEGSELNSSDLSYFAEEMLQERASEESVDP